MEPNKPIVNHISCPLHEDLIRKVGISDNKTNLSLLCVDCCLEGKQYQELHTLENFLKQISQSYLKIPKLQHLPDSTNQILNTENEIVANFSLHIEKQKEQVNTVIDKFRQSVYQMLESKKRQLMANLEAQLSAFQDALSFYKQKVFTYKEGYQDNHVKNQGSAVTFEHLYGEVSKMTNAAELKRLLLLHYDSMKSAEIFSRMKDDEAKKLVIGAIEAMDTQLMQIQALKTTVSFGAMSAENFEETLKVWSEQIDSVINGLKVGVKDPVKAIEFQLPNPIDFDSAILKNDFSKQNMIANWVFETIKAKESSFNLLYRGSRDGFRANNFHQSCDNKGPTVIIIESTTGHKFGGYASINWTSGTNGNYVDIKTKESFGSFLFLVDKKQKLPYKPESDLRTLCHSPLHGPIFGVALAIYDECNTSNSNYYRSECPSYQSLMEGGNISGPRNFLVKEIEVYSVMPK